MPLPDAPAREALIMHKMKDVRFEITDDVVNLSKLVTVFCVVHWSCKIFQIDQVFSNDAELVFPVDVVDRV